VCVCVCVCVNPHTEKQIALSRETANVCKILVVKSVAQPGFSIPGANNRSDRFLDFKLSPCSECCMLSSG